MSKTVRLTIIRFIGIWGLWLGGNISPAIAQTLPPEDVAERVYQNLPYLPTENQHINRETEQVDQDNTLISRLVRYHQYIKTRSTGDRLDWQLTIADYLGINEPIQPSRYPGNSTLTINPYERDRAIIDGLPRRQRRELIDTLVGIYSSEEKNSTPTLEDSASPNNSQSQPQLPQPGDAELLLP